MEPFNLCIIKPNKNAFSETFIQAHIDGLTGNKKVLYGGVFPAYDNEGKFLIRSKSGILSYLIQKKIFKKKDIKVRTNALANYLKKEHIDVVLAEYGMVGAQVTEACQLSNVPLVIHFHGADAHHSETVSTYHDLYLKAFQYACAIVAVSADMVEALVQLGAPQDKLILNPYGVNTNKFTQVDVVHSAVNFVSVGRFVEKKSPLAVVEAFAEVSRKFPDARLWMVGDGPLLIKTKQFSNSLNLSDKIIFTGILSSNEIQRLMQQMRCFIQHSVTAADGDMEGTPNTILEAAASGLPIVSTFHAGIKQAVIDGVTGYLVSEHAIEAMAEKMIYLAENPVTAAQLGAEGRKHVLENYNMPDRIKSLDDIIHRCGTHGINSDRQ